MMHRSSSSSEHGASAILVSASLLLLIGMAAVAVDLGAGWNERRQDQTAADLGALAGSIDYLAPVSADAVTLEVLTNVQENLDTVYNPSDWETLWSNCTDPDMPSGFAPLAAPSSWGIATIPCISGSFDELRVRIPDQIVKTSFGGVLGANELSTQASAHATFVYRQNGNPKPWGLVDGLGAGEQCISTPGSGLAAPPCDGASSGNFGTLLVDNWGSDSTVIDCGTPGADELAINVALGMDHIVGVARNVTGSGGTYSTPIDSETRLDACQVVGGEVQPSDSNPLNMALNTLLADTGVSANDAVFNGLISGQDGFANGIGTITPLLQQIPANGFSDMTGVTSARYVTQRLASAGEQNYLVDNTPLFEHLRSVSDLASNSDGYTGLTSGLQSTCDRVSLRGIASTGGDWTSVMSQCLLDWETLQSVTAGPLQPLFGDSLDKTPRFGWSPQFHFTNWGSGSHWQPVKTYRMIYINRIWFNCNGSYNSPNTDEPCDGGTEGRGGIVFTPMSTYDETEIKKGSGGSVKQLRLDQVSAFLIPQGAAPEEIESSYPGNVTGPFEIQLVR